MGKRRRTAIEGGVTAPPSAWFYPDRKRCLACRRFFGVLVIKRLYCSYPCAGMEPPSADVSSWPRECRTGANQPKRRYTYPELVTCAATDGTSIHVYPCGYCGMYHIGHLRREDMIKRNEGE